MKALLITGTIHLTPTHAALPFGKYVFQRVAPGRGNLPDRPAADLQLRRHVIPTDPKTAPQLARRALMAAAVARWRASDAAAREQWRELAKRRNIALFNACISDTLDNYHLEGDTLVRN